MPSRRQVLASASVLTGILAGCQSVLTSSPSGCDPPSVSTDPADWAAPAHDLANTGVAPEGSAPDYPWSRRWAIKGYENPETKSINADFSSGAGHPLLVGDRALFTVPKRYETESPDIRLYALRLDDASEDWHVDLWRPSGLFVAGAHVYYQAYSMDKGEQVIARSVKTGEKAWAAQVDGELAINPTLAGNRVLYGERIDESTSRIRAVDPETGDSCWKTELNGLEYSVAVGEQFAFYGVYRGNDTPDSVTALDPTTGEQEWMTRLEAGNAREIAIRGDLVHVCTHRRYAAIETETGAFLWQDKSPVLNPDIGAVTDSTLLLKGRPGSATTDRPERIVACDRADGTVNWQTEESLDARFLTLPTVSEEQVYFVASTAPRDASSLLTYGLESGDRQSARELPAGSVRRPVIARNRALLMTLGGLYLLS